MSLKSVGRQWKLEAEAARLGAERLRVNTLRDEERDYSSGTLWGRKLVNQQVSVIARRIEATKKRLTQGKAQTGATKLQDVINQVEPEVLAAIAAKRCLDSIGQGRDNSGKHNNTYARICVSIGKAVESECRFRWYEKQAPKEFEAIKFFHFKKTTGTQQKDTIAKVLMGRKGFRWASWSSSKRHQIGAFLLDCIAQSVDWFQSRRLPNQPKRKGEHLIEIHPSLKDLKEQIMALAALHAPLAWPMVSEPADWTTEIRGGYLTNELRSCHRLVRGQRGAIMMGQRPLDMLNTLQKVAYRINPVTLQLMFDLEAREETLGSFCLQSNEEPLPKPEGDYNEETWKDWKKARTAQENRNAALMGKRFRTLETISIARKFMSEEKIYIPWSFDWRGRVYPIVTFMSPQGTDMEKSLYLFAKSRPVTDDAKRWLAIQVANTAGQDKLTLEDRIQWTKTHESLIARIAQDPIDNLHELEAFDSPWTGLAACAEYYNCVITGEQTETSLPISTDATCSGIQHLSSMTLCKKTASLVNVCPTPAPADAYKAVLKRTIEILDEDGHHELARLGEKVGRPLSKRVVMTVPYAATLKSNKGYILQAIHEAGFKASSADAMTIAKCMLIAMKEILPGPIAVMEWIKTSTRSAFRDHEGTEIIEWTTPSGFLVKQDKRIPDVQRVKTKLLGDVIQTSVANGYNGPNVNKHCSGGAPNWIHSMDASLLHNSFAGFDQPFTLIHDSILTTATDMSYMSDVIRDEFVKIYEARPLELLAKTLKAVIPPGMIIGDLDISNCRSSVYFFC